MFAMKSSSLKIIGYAGTVITLSTLTLSLLNPKSLMINYQKNDFTDRPAEPSFFNISTLNIKKPEEIQQFRNGSKRSAFYRSEEEHQLSKVSSTRSLVVNHGLHSASKSSPIKSDSFILISGDQGLIQVLDKVTHKLHWKLQLYDSNLGIHSSPVTFADYALIGDYSGKLYFLNLLEKSIIWISDWGDTFGASPLLEEENLYVNVETSRPADGFVAKLNILTQEVLWMTPFLGEQSHSSLAADKTGLFFGNNNGHFFKLDKNTGDIMWKIELERPIKSTPAIFENLIIFSSWDGHVNAFDKNTGLLAWSYYLGKDTNQSSLAVSEDHAYGAINSAFGFSILDLKTGSLVKEFKMKTAKASRMASPIILQNEISTRVLTPCAEDQICIVDLSTLELRVLPLDKRLGSSGQLTPVGKRIYFSPNQEHALHYIE